MIILLLFVFIYLLKCYMYVTIFVLLNNATKTQVDILLASLPEQFCTEEEQLKELQQLEEENQRAGELLKHAQEEAGALSSAYLCHVFIYLITVDIDIDFDISILKK